MKLGAEDYVTKPFPMSVFQKKLAVVLGRLTKQYGGDTYEDGTLTINFSEMSAACQESHLHSPHWNIDF